MHATWYLRATPRCTMQPLQNRDLRCLWPFQRFRFACHPYTPINENSSDNQWIFRHCTFRNPFSLCSGTKYFRTECRRTREKANRNFVDHFQSTDSYCRVVERVDIGELCEAEYARCTNRAVCSYISGIFGTIGPDSAFPYGVLVRSHGEECQDRFRTRSGSWLRNATERAYQEERILLLKIHSQGWTVHAIKVNGSLILSRTFHVRRGWSVRRQDLQLLIRRPQIKSGVWSPSFRWIVGSSAVKQRLLSVVARTIWFVLLTDMDGGFYVVDSVDEKGSTARRTVGAAKASSVL